MIGEHSPGAEDRAPRLAFLVVCLLAALAVGGRAVRDGLFLSVFRFQELPKAMVVGSALCLIAAGPTLRAIGRFGPRNVATVFAAAGGSAFALECLLLQAMPRGVTVAVYLHVVVLGALGVLAFFGVLAFLGIAGLGALSSGVGNRSDDRRTAGTLAAAVGLGCVVGGVLTERVTAWLGVRAALLVLALLCAAVAGVVQRLPENAVPRRPERSGMSELGRSRCLRTVSGLVAVVGFISLVADYVLKLEASRALRSTHMLVSFFAAFYAVVTAAGFVTSTWLARPALRRLGVGATLAALPASVLLTGVYALGLTRLWTAALLKGSEAVLNGSLLQTTRELLASPFATDTNWRTETVARDRVERVGEIAAGVLLIGLVAFAPGLPSSVLVGLVVLCAAGCLWVSYRATQIYVTELSASLRAGALRVGPHQVCDATTRAVVDAVTNSTDREQMLAELKRLRRSRVGVIQPPSTPSHPPDSRLPNDSALMETLGELTAGEPSRVLAALEGGPLDARTLPQVITLLANDRVAVAAGMALRQCAKAAAGQLGDALLDPRQSFAVRRRVPRLLAEVKDSRVVAALLEALNDEQSEVRQRSGRALHQIVVERPDLRPEPWVVHEAAMREIEMLPPPEAHEAADAGLRRRARAQVRHVLTLTGLGGEPEAVELAARALDSGDEKLRGTAVEYLDSVLPAHLRPKLMAHLGKVSDDGRPSRSRRELVEELARARAASAEMDESLPPPPGDPPQ